MSALNGLGFRGFREFRVWGSRTPKHWDPITYTSTSFQALYKTRLAGKVSLKLCHSLVRGPVAAFYDTHGLQPNSVCCADLQKEGFGIWYTNTIRNMGGYDC